MEEVAKKVHFEEKYELEYSYCCGDVHLKETIATTKGFVSRMVVTFYARRSTEMLGNFTEVAFNHGISGTTDFNQEECIGIAIQAYRFDDAAKIEDVIQTYRFEEQFNAPLAYGSDVSLKDGDVVHPLPTPIYKTIYFEKKERWGEKCVPQTTQVIVKCDLSQWQKVYYLKKKEEEEGTLLKKGSKGCIGQFGSVEEVTLEWAKKMGIDSKVLQAGLYNTTATAQVEREMLKDVMHRGTRSHGTSVPNKREINHLIARPRLLALFKNHLLAMLGQVKQYAH
ncbi:hypothetical protein Ccrd_022148 [Cynara cardunculus var. scolymus]|uniref:Uncharacterized protein n=1 Tax=Cynara cardunculus var. scolymus TaxID=59895 RepID=A0A103XZC3_CYNCS|nr:hypothetical protein Ccrd_022148 [Cynara cardunculus var. scolymus]